MKTEEDYQDAIELNPGQKRAFSSLRRAVKRCKEENILFYQKLEKLCALNGDNVKDVADDGFSGGKYGDPNCLQDKDYPTVETACSFADDNHFIFLHDE